MSVGSEKNLYNQEAAHELVVGLRVLQMVQAKRFRVRDLVERYGSTPAEIAEFQRHGLLKPRQDDEGLYYSPGDETRLQIARKALRLGFTLREIAAMVAIVAGMSAASLMLHLTSLCRICLKTGMPYADVFYHTVI